MEKDCFVKTLKGDSQNNDAPILNAFVVKAPIGNNSMTISSPSGFTLEINGDGHFSDSTYTQDNGKKYEHVSGSGIIYVVASEEVDIVVKDNYEVNALTLLSGVFADKLDFTEYRNLQTFEIRNSATIKNNKGSLYLNDGIVTVHMYNDTVFDFDISEMSGKTSLTTMQIYGNPNVKGNLSSISDCENLATLEITKASVGGKVEEAFASLTKLTTLDLRNTGIADFYLEDLCEAWFGNRNTNCSVRFTNAKLKNGTTLNSYAYVIDYTGSGITISQNSSTIATYNGSSWTYN